MAAPARQAVKAAVDKSSLLYKFRRWMYYKSYFPEIGLRKDDTILEDFRHTHILKEALRRLPQNEIDARNFRILRAHQLSMMKTVLPRDQWTDFETDTPYLWPYIREVEKELKEKKEWNSV